MSQRYTQDRATTQRHLAILKDLVRQPGNKLCADCKRNDPRWASTNLGLFVCIRCSGHHRGMGVHISRVKSVDLDTWTPEQIHHMQRWGNHRANLYWEAHLKPGHMPPDHKIESFIRSKYELKRWAREGPVPEPESLDAEAAAAPAPAPTEDTPAAPSRTRKNGTPSNGSSSLDLLGGSGSSARKATGTTAVHTAGRTPAAAVPPSSSTKPREASLFDLDFDSAPAAPVHAARSVGSPSPARSPAPAPAAAPAPKRDPKADILSLFNAAPSPPPALSHSHSASASATRSHPAHPSQPQQGNFNRAQSHSGGSSVAAAPTAAGGGGGGFGGLSDSLAGLSFGSAAGSGGFNHNHNHNHNAGGIPRSGSTTSDWGGFTSAEPSHSAAPAPAPATTDPWGGAAAASGADVWGAPPPLPPPVGAGASRSYAPAAAVPAKADPFADFGAFTGSASASRSAGGGGGNQFGGDIWGTATNGSGNVNSAAGGGGFSDIWG